MPRLLALLRRLPQGLQFIAVGSAAAATHLLVVALLVQGLGLQPLVANVLAFALAFGVSYSGHAALTFAAQQSPTRQSLPRFLCVAVSAFALNECLYYLALRVLHWHYLWALLVVLVAVAIATFVAAKFWAFARGAA